MSPPLSVRAAHELDVGVLYRLALDPPHWAFRRLFGASVPPPGEGITRLWHNAAGVFSVEHGDEVVAFFRLVDVRLADGHASLEAASRWPSDHPLHLAVLDAARRFVFLHWPVRKLSVALASPRTSPERLALAGWQVEVRYPRALFVDGERADKVVIASFRDHLPPHPPIATKGAAMADRLSYEEFCGYLASGLERDVEDVARLGHEDGLFDSPDYLEVFLLMDDLGVPVDFDTAVETTTVEAWFELYQATGARTGATSA